MQALFMLFELTRRCQLDCLHCLKGTKNDGGVRNVDLSFELYKKILDQAIHYGVRRVGFAGGEPTLNPRFADILAYTCSKGPTISMITNGWNFPKVAPLLKDCGSSFEQVSFSLDGAKEETHDYHRGRGSYRRIMEAIDICNKENLPFGLQTVVTAVNHTEVGEVALLGARLGTKTLRFMDLQPTPESARQGLDLPPEKYLEIGAQVAQLAKSFRFPMVLAVGSHVMSRWFPCPAQHMEEFDVDAWGNLALCSVLTSRAGALPGSEVAGNLAEMSFYEAHRRLIQLIAGFQQAKASAIEGGDFDNVDLHFPCWWCTKYFGKADWLADFPNHPWNSGAEAETLACRAAG